MLFPNLNYFNNYAFAVKLLLLAIFCFLTIGCWTKQVKQVLPARDRILISEKAVSINTASAEELEKLPHIGAKTAQRIIEHREKFGRFRRPAHLMLVQGISDGRFREMQSLIKVE